MLQLSSLTFASPEQIHYFNMTSVSYIRHDFFQKFPTSYFQKWKNTYLLIFRGGLKTQHTVFLYGGVFMLKLESTVFLNVTTYIFSRFVFFIIKNKLLNEIFFTRPQYLVPLDFVQFKQLSW